MTLFKQNVAKFKPNFEKVNAKDAENLLYEAFWNKLSHIALFRTSNQSFLIEFAQNMQSRVYNKGEKIYKRGQPADKFYVIKRGAVHFYIPGGFEIPFIQVSDGYFGEFELMELDSESDKGKRKVSCEAIENDTKVYTIDKKLFFKLFINGDTSFAKEFRIRTGKREKDFM